MLIEFKVENFRSIREEQTLSFVGNNSDKELPGNYLEPNLPGMPEVRLLKVAAVYGANASGKSNIIRAIRFFADFAVDSFTNLKPDAPTGTVPFRFEKKWATHPSFFEASVIIEGVRYTYGVALTAERVTEEYLIAFPNGKAQTWFEREWNPKTKTYAWSPSTNHFKYEEALRAGTRANCTFLSAGPQFNHPKLKLIREWFARHFNRRSFNIAHRTPNVTAHICSEVPEAHEMFLDFLKKADLGILDFKVEKVPSAVDMDEAQLLRDKSAYRVKFRHQGQDAESWLSLAEQSDGTQRLFAVAVPWLASLGGGDFICMDEIETSLHPFLARELIKLFLGSRNEKGAQLLFTTHNPVLLDQDLLRRDQFWFTEKDTTGATHLYPLTDYSPRKEEALMKGYLAGRYGGVPFIPETLAQQPISIPGKPAGPMKAAPKPRRNAAKGRKAP